MKMLSVITPCWNESENLRDCIIELQKVLDQIDYEHIFIDNSSTDDTLAKLLDLKTEFPQIRVFANSQNVGVFSSIQRALRVVRGNWVVPFFAADLQDPPTVILEMIKLQEKTNSDSVFAVRETRSENAFIFFLRKMFYRIIRQTTEKSYVSGTSEFCLIKSSVAFQIAEIEDANPFLRLYLSQLRGKVQYVNFAMKERNKGKSSANLFSLTDDALNAFSLVLPSVFSRILIGSILGVAIGFLVCIFSIIDIILLPLNLEKLFTPGLILLGFSIMMGMNAVIGHYVYIIHSNVRKKLTATTVEV
jgi:glycosyltransferase involved in cell wall biosynthesis